MPDAAIALDVLAGELAICRLPGGSAIPGWALASSFLSITRTRDELSVVCESGLVPDDVTCARSYVALRVRGPLALEMVGVMAAIASPLATAGVPVFVVATHDTDYVLLRAADRERAFAALGAAGIAIG